MKPSPPVTKMLFTVGSGSKEVWLVRTRASCHVPSSTKKRDSRLVGPPDMAVHRRHCTARVIKSKQWAVDIGRYLPLAPQAESSSVISLVPVRA
jgi:hypothetical protein